MLTMKDSDFRAWKELFDKHKEEGEILDLDSVPSRYHDILHALHEYVSSYRKTAHSYSCLLNATCHRCDILGFTSLHFCKGLYRADLRKWNKAAKAAYTAEYNRLFGKKKGE